LLVPAISRHTGIYLTSMSALAISHHSKIGLSS
jgi:hypothetical protein